MSGAEGRWIQADGLELLPAPLGRGCNANLVQVVSSIRMNSLVVSKVVERCGLKAFATGVTDAMPQFERRLPGIVILDGGADNRECSDIVGHLSRASAGTGRPALLFLSIRCLTADEEADLGPPDAVVSKPINPDTLQPAIRELAQRLHGGS